MTRWNRLILLGLVGLAIAAPRALAEDDTQANPLGAVSVDEAESTPTEQPDTSASLQVGSEALYQPALPDRERLPLGASTNPPTRSELNADVSTTTWWVQTVLALGVVISLIFAMRWLVRKMNGTAAMGGGGSLVEVLARAPIGYKTQVVFLRVNERIIVAGQTPAGINTLAQFDEPDDVAAVLQQVTSSRTGSIAGGFAKILGQHQSGENDIETGADDEEVQVDRARDGMSSLINRIRRLRDGGEQ